MKIFVIVSFLLTSIFGIQAAALCRDLGCSHSLFNIPMNHEDRALAEENQHLKDIIQACRSLAPQATYPEDPALAKENQRLKDIIENYYLQSLVKPQLVKKYRLPAPKVWLKEVSLIFWNPRESYIRINLHHISGNIDYLKRILRQGWSYYQENTSKAQLEEDLEEMMCILIRGNDLLLGVRKNDSDSFDKLSGDIRKSLLKKYREQRKGRDLRGRSRIYMDEDSQNCEERLLSTGAAINNDRRLKKEEECRRNANERARKLADDEKRRRDIESQQHRRFPDTYDAYTVRVQIEMRRNR